MINRPSGSLEVDADRETVSDQLRDGQCGFPPKVREPLMHIRTAGCLIEQNILGSAEGKLRVSLGLFQNITGTPMVVGYMGPVLHLVLHPYLYNTVDASSVRLSLRKANVMVSKGTCRN